MDYEAAARALLLLTILAGPSFASDWPMLARDASRSGATPDEIRPPFARKWHRAFVDEGIHTGVQPIVAGGTVYLGTLRGVLHAIDAETGIDAWTYRAGGAILHAAASDGDRVFFGAGDGKVHALDAKSGKPLWSVQTGAAVWNAPVVHEGKVIFGGRDGKVYACDAASGRVYWGAQVGSPILQSPAIDAKRGRVYVGAEDMRVYAFDLDDGKATWKSPKLPGVSFRGYHPVVAPDGAVMATVTPLAGGDALQQILLDMVKEVFGDFASWRIKDEERKNRIRAENFELMKDPATYVKQLEYLRRRLADEPGMQTFFVLDPETGRQRFVAPIVYAESMNGPGSPPVVTSDGKVIAKYSALLRSRYEHYSPFLNVGYLDTKTGHVTPIMDPSRTYGWHDSLLLVHDEQSQLSVGGRVLFNTHQDNINALDLDTLKGYPHAMAHNVHEVKEGTAAAIWSMHLKSDIPNLKSRISDFKSDLPLGWEWFARGTAVYGGGSVVDVPIAIAGDSFYFLPTHELNAGVVLLAYKMDTRGNASHARAEPKQELSAEQWQAIVRDFKWDWDLLTLPRLDHILKGRLPGSVSGTLTHPRHDEAKQRARAITDAELDRFILAPATSKTRQDAALDTHRAQLASAVSELISRDWRPLLFPAGKHPAEAYRLFVDPAETLYTLALAYPHLPEDLRERVKSRVESLYSGPLSASSSAGTYDLNKGAVRSSYDEVPASLTPRVQLDLIRSDTARLYPLWLYASATGDWSKLKTDWPKLKGRVDARPGKDEFDLGNARISGLIAACRIARELHDAEGMKTFLSWTRAAVRERLEYEFAHTDGGVITRPPAQRTIFGRWRYLTPDLAAILRHYSCETHRRFMDVYVDYHRPTWWLAWGPELLWRNETPFSFPTMSLEIFSARTMILREDPHQLAGFLDIPWCRADECHIQKLSMTLMEFQ